MYVLHVYIITSCMSYIIYTCKRHGSLEAFLSRVEKVLLMK